MKFVIKKQYILPAIIVLVYLTCYCLISLVNHYNFRTHALDLGLHIQSLYDYSHFNWNYNPILYKDNVLGDHFGLYPMLISPLVWIFGTYTLLIVQIASIIIGGLGVYSVVRLQSKNDILASLSLIFFYSIWGIYSALAFDYHEVVLSAMAVPWLFYYYLKRSVRGIILTFLFVIIGKENMALWCLFLMLGLALLYFKDKKLRNLSLILAGFSVVYFIVILNYVMPLFYLEWYGYKHFNYPALGGTPGEALKTIITRPFYTFKLLFENTTDKPYYDGIKAELHYVVLLSGGIFLFIKPQYLLMLLPIYAQKMFNSDMTKWGINAHYSIEFVPILALATFHFIAGFKKDNLKYIVAGVSIVLCIFITLNKFNQRQSKWYSRVEAQFTIAAHYKTDYDVKETYRALKLIPKDARVRAQENMCPHLALRDSILVIHKPGNVDFVVFHMASKSYWPYNKEAYFEQLEGYRDNPDWETFYSTEEMLIFKHKDYEYTKP